METLHKSVHRERLCYKSKSLEGFTTDDLVNLAEEKRFRTVLTDQLNIIHKDGTYEVYFWADKEKQNNK